MGDGFTLCGDTKFNGPGNIKSIQSTKTEIEVIL